MDRRAYLVALGGAVTATALLDGKEARASGQDQPVTTSPPTDGPSSTAGYRVAIYVTEALARTARDTGYWSVVRPAAQVASQLRFSTNLLEVRLVHEPVVITEDENHRLTWQAWRKSNKLGGDDAALLLTTTRSGEYDGYGGTGYAVAEAEDLVYYEGGPRETAKRNEAFAHTLAVACHEVGHALGLAHDHHATVTMPDGAQYVTLMGVGAPGVEYNGTVLQYSAAAARTLTTRG